MAKRKQLTLAQEVEKAAVLLQRYVRLKASDDNGYCTCVTCGKVDNFQAMHGGHFIPRNRSRLKLLEENIHPQCPQCNCWGMKQTHYVLRYRDYMVDNYGERRVKAFEKLAWMTSPKFDRQEVLDFQKELKEKIKIEEERVGIFK
jgi:5-methylcytosine-specific restriction endonuclease McrA